MGRGWGIANAFPAERSASINNWVQMSLLSGRPFDVPEALATRSQVYIGNNAYLLVRTRAHDGWTVRRKWPALDQLLSRARRRRIHPSPGHGRLLRTIEMPLRRFRTGLYASARLAPHEPR